MKDENEPGRISDNSYFLIGDNFYYHGNALRKKLDEILSLNVQYH